MQNERVKRRALVQVALWLTARTPLAPTKEERQLLTQFVHGRITMDQLCALTDELLCSPQAVTESARATATASI